MSENNFFLFIDKKVLSVLFIIFIINIILRVPGVYQELPPNSFCDEDLITNYAFKNYNENKIYYYGLGQINYYLAAIPSYFSDLFLEQKLSRDKFIVLSRFLGPVFFNSIGAVIIFFTINLLTKSLIVCSLFSILFTFSPMNLGLSRIFYPDHYLIIFSTVCLFLSLLSIKGLSNNLSIIVGSFTVAFAASVKIHGFVLILPLIFSNLNFFQKGSEFNFFSIKSSIIKTLFIIFGSLIFFSLLNPSLFIEGFTVLEKYIDWKRSIYSKDYEYLMSNNPYAFYMMVSLFCSFGVSASLLFIIGFIKVYRSDLQLFLTLISCPIVLILFFGQLKLIVIRNMNLSLPFLLIFIAYGYFNSIHIIKNQFLKYMMISVLFIEPVSKSLFSFFSDFKIDSRIKTREWVSKNIIEGSTIASNKGCFQPFPFDSDKFNSIDLGFSSSMIYLENYDNIDYLIIDSWFGDMIGKNKHKSEQSWTIIFTEKIFNNLTFINAGGMFHENKYQKGLLRNNYFEHIHTIRGYGPDIFIYENKRRFIGNS